MTAFDSVKLINRSMSLVIGFPNNPEIDAKIPFNTENSIGLDISGIDVDFHVSKSLRASEPNVCSLRVFNLAADTRQSFSGDHVITVKLDAGYKGQTAQIFFAECHAAWTEREGANFITHIESSDTVARPTGVRKTKKPQEGAIGTVAKTYGATVKIDDAFDAIVAQLGVKKGNLTDALKGVQHLSFPGGALTGPAAQRMTDLCRSAGLEWSVQDGVLQFLNIGEALSSQGAISITAETGMVGSPSVDSQGAISVKTLMIPGLAPGRLIEVDSLFVQKAGYRIEKIRYVGSTYGPDWYCELDAVRY